MSKYYDKKIPIEMYKDNYNKVLEYYYKLNKQFKYLHELLIKFQSKNQKLRNKLDVKNNNINKALKFIDSMFDDGDDDKIIDNLLKLEEILKGEDNEN